MLLISRRRSAVISSSGVLGAWKNGGARATSIRLSYYDNEAVIKSFGLYLDAELNSGEAV
jgi:hypothetical protein